MRVPIDESVGERAPVAEMGRTPASSWSLGVALILRRLMRNRLAVVSAYIAAYVVLDRLSTVHVLPHVGFTLWNPPPACSLALLLWDRHRARHMDRRSRGRYCELGNPARGCADR